MSLADEARALGKSSGGICAVAKLLATLGPDEQAEVIEALGTPVSAARLAKAIKLRGWAHTGDQSIQRHRIGVCRCEPQ